MTLCLFVFDLFRESDRRLDQVTARTTLPKDFELVGDGLYLIAALIAAAADRVISYSVRGIGTQDISFAIAVRQLSIFIPLNVT